MDGRGGQWLLQAWILDDMDSNNPSIVQSGLHERILSSIEDDNDVQFYWSGLAGNWDEEDSDEILQMLALQYITSRGHSFASAFNETYKNDEQKTLEKTKGIRKNLIGKYLIYSIGSWGVYLLKLIYRPGF